MDTQPQLKKIADFGTGEAWLARTEMTMLEFLPFLRVENNQDGDPISDVEMAKFKAKQEAATGLAMAIAEELGSAFIDLRRLREANGNLPTELETAKAYRDLYGHLWVSYKSRFQDLMKLLGYDIGFIFQDDKKFDQAVGEFQTNHSDINPELFGRIREDKESWQKALYTYRNDGEHNAKEPTFNGHPMHDLRNAEVIFSNVWHAIEDIFIHCMQEEFGQQLTIFEIPKEDRKTEIPKKYAIGLSIGTSTGEVKSRT